MSICPKSQTPGTPWWKGEETSAQCPLISTPNTILWPVDTLSPYYLPAIYLYGPFSLFLKSWTHIFIRVATDCSTKQHWVHFLDVSVFINLTQMHPAVPSSELTQIYRSVYVQKQPPCFHILQKPDTFLQACGIKLPSSGTWNLQLSSECGRNWVTILEKTVLLHSLIFFQLPCCEGTWLRWAPRYGSSGRWLELRSWAKC